MAILTLDNIQNQADDLGTDAVNNAGKLFNRAFSDLGKSAQQVQDNYTKEFDTGSKAKLNELTNLVGGMNDLNQFGSRKQELLDSILNDTGFNEADRTSATGIVNGREDIINNDITSAFKLNEQRLAEQFTGVTREKNASILSADASQLEAIKAGLDPTNINQAQLLGNIGKREDTLRTEAQQTRNDRLQTQADSIGETQFQIDTINKDQALSDLKESGKYKQEDDNFSTNISLANDIDNVRLIMDNLNQASPNAAVLKNQAEARIKTLQNATILEQAYTRGQRNTPEKQADFVAKYGNLPEKEQQQKALELGLDLRSLVIARTAAQDFGGDTKRIKEARRQLLRKEKNDDENTRATKALARKKDLAEFNKSLDFKDPLWVNSYIDGLISNGYGFTDASNAKEIVGSTIQSGDLTPEEAVRLITSALEDDDSFNVSAYKKEVKRVKNAPAKALADAAAAQANIRLEEAKVAEQKRQELLSRLNIKITN